MAYEHGSLAPAGKLDHDCVGRASKFFNVPRALE
jgi:hypothetical protein